MVKCCLDVLKMIIAEECVRTTIEDSYIQQLRPCSVKQSFLTEQMSYHVILERSNSCRLGLGAVWIQICM